MITFANFVGSNLVSLYDIFLSLCGETPEESPTINIPEGMDCQFSGSITTTEGRYDIEEGQHVDIQAKDNTTNGKEYYEGQLGNTVLQVDNLNEIVEISFEFDIFGDYTGKIDDGLEEQISYYYDNQYSLCVRLVDDVLDGLLDSFEFDHVIMTMSKLIHIDVNKLMNTRCITLLQASRRKFEDNFEKILSLKEVGVQKLVIRGTSEYINFEPFILKMIKHGLTVCLVQPFEVKFKIVDDVTLLTFYEPDNYFKCKNNLDQLIDKLKVDKVNIVREELDRRTVPLEGTIDYRYQYTSVEGESIKKVNTIKYRRESDNSLTKMYLKYKKKNKAKSARFIQ